MAMSPSPRAVSEATNFILLIEYLACSTPLARSTAWIVSNSRSTILVRT